jgi:CubicO group peptidase (beta-lactamase class C family)
MKRRFFLLVLLATTITFSSFAQHSRLKLDSLMDYYAREYCFNGVALIADRSGILLEKAYGYRDFKKKAKHTTESIFQVGTLTVPFTTELTAMLAHDHLLNLGDTVGQFFPNHPNSGFIALKYLLAGSSGIRDYTDKEVFIRRHDSFPAERDTLLSRFIDKPPMFPPGSYFYYTNGNYLLLGYVLELAMHKSYFDMVREKLLGPAGMVHSGFDYRALDSKNKSVGYRYYHSGHPIPQLLLDSTFTGAAGSLYSTVEDLYLWHKALQSYYFLDSQSQERLYYPNRDKHHLHASGWNIDTFFNKRALWYGGNVRGFSNHLLRIPVDGVCIILMENLDHTCIDQTTLTKSIVECLYDSTFRIPQPTPITKVPRKVLAKYEGEYQFNTNYYVEVRATGDSLHVKGFSEYEPEANDYYLQPIGENQFKSREISATISFDSDSTGHVDGMELITQHGKLIGRRR